MIPARALRDVAPDDFGAIASDGPAVPEVKAAAALALSGEQIDTAIPQNTLRNQHYVEIACPDCLVDDERQDRPKPWGRRFAKRGACMSCGNKSWTPAGEGGGYQQRRRLKELRTEMWKVTGAE